MNLSFRTTSPNEVKEMFAVRARTREHGMSLEQLAEIGITPQSVTADLVSGKVTSAACFDENVLVGFCNGDRETGEVLVLAVLADYEGQGIGKRLLARVVEALREAGCARIWLSATTDPAMRAHGFYRALGWQPTGETLANGSEILILV
jgi:GNAT superfamily N-acetyltransferase